MPGHPHLHLVSSDAGISWATDGTIRDQNLKEKCHDADNDATDALAAHHGGSVLAGKDGGKAHHRAEQHSLSRS